MEPLKSTTPSSDEPVAPSDAPQMVNDVTPPPTAPASPPEVSQEVAAETAPDVSTPETDVTMSELGIPTVEVEAPEAEPAPVAPAPSNGDSAPFVPNSSLNETPADGTVLSGEPSPDSPASDSLPSTSSSDSSALPAASEAPAEAPADMPIEDDFSPKFEEASNSPHDNVPVAAPGAFAAAVAAEVSKPTEKPKSPTSANSIEAAAQKQGHAHSRKLLVLVATLLGLLLAAGVIYLYVSSNKAAQPEEPLSSQTNDASTAAEDAGAVIDESQKDLDSINDADFADSELSDASLGL